MGSDICGTCFSANSRTIFSKEVNVGLSEIHSFDFSGAVVLVVLRGCLCFAGMLNKDSDAALLQVRVLQACQIYQNISVDVSFGSYLAVAVVPPLCFVHAGTGPV